MEWLSFIPWIIFPIVIIGFSRLGRRKPKEGGQDSTRPRPLEGSGVRNQGTQPRPPVRVERERHSH